jgi:hypothetical protein
MKDVPEWDYQSADESPELGLKCGKHGEQGIPLNVNTNDSRVFRSNQFTVLQRMASFPLR